MARRSVVPESRRLSRGTAQFLPSRPDDIPIVLDVVRELMHLGKDDPAPQPPPLPEKKDEKKKEEPKVDVGQ